MRTLCGTILVAAAAFTAQGAAMLECSGLVTEKVAGWRFEASGVKGGAAMTANKIGTFVGSVPVAGFKACLRVGGGLRGGSCH